MVSMMTRRGSGAREIKESAGACPVADAGLPRVAASAFARVETRVAPGRVAPAFPVMFDDDDDDDDDDSPFEDDDDSAEETFDDDAAEDDEDFLDDEAEDEDADEFEDDDDDDDEEL